VVLLLRRVLGADDGLLSLDGKFVETHDASGNIKQIKGQWIAVLTYGHFST
jgi:hypothetical protein